MYVNYHFLFKKMKETQQPTCKHHIVNLVYGGKPRAIGRCVRPLHGVHVRTRAVCWFLVSISVDRGNPMEIKGSQVGGSPHDTPQGCSEKPYWQSGSRALPMVV